MKDVTIGKYLADLGSSIPSIGGGGAGALSGAMGAALVSMVANLSLGRDKYAEFQGLISDTLNEAEKLAADLNECMTKDSNAFDCVIQAFRLPKNTDEEKAVRSQAVQSAYKIAASVPAETAEKCLRVMQLAEGLLFKSNATAASDLSVAAIQARAGILTSLENVYVNLAVIRDTEYVARMQAWAESIDTESQKLLDIIRDGAAKMSGGK